MYINGKIKFYFGDVDDDDDDYDEEEEDEDGEKNKTAKNKLTKEELLLSVPNRDIRAIAPALGNEGGVDMYHGNICIMTKW
jgi:hypothetical protein